MASLSNRLIVRNRPATRRSPAAAVEAMEGRVLFSTYVVNTTSDVTSAADGKTTLREAIALANAHAGADTINFAASAFPSGASRTIAITGTPLTLTDQSATTINGTGTATLAVTGNFGKRLLLVQTNGRAVVNKVTFKGSLTGGGVANYGTLTMNNAAVTGNTVNANATGFEARGGGIFSAGTLVLNACTVSGNKAVGKNYGYTDGDVVRPGGPASGGGVYAEGGLTISFGSATGNSASGGTGEYNSYFQGPGGAARGGGVWAKALLTVSNATLSGNTATGGTGESAGAAAGGAIFAATGFGVVNVTGVTITGNAARGGQGSGRGAAGGDADGGGIYSARTTAIKTSTLASNTAAGGNSSFTEPGNVVQAGRARGGGAFQASGSLTVSASTFSSNGATGGTRPDQGVAVQGGDALGGGLYAASSATLTNATFALNSARGGASRYDESNFPAGGAGRGGGIYSTAALNLNSSTISANTVGGGTNASGGGSGPASGGGLHVAGGTAIAKNTILSGNKLAGGAFNDVSGSLNAASSASNLIGVGGGLANGVKGNKVGITNPKLNALANNGGPTKTMLPQAGSPVINAGNKALLPAGLTTDQRGLARVLGGLLDIGAVEKQ